MKRQIVDKNPFEEQKQPAEKGQQKRWGGFYSYFDKSVKSIEKGVDQVLTKIDALENSQVAQTLQEKIDRHTGKKQASQSEPAEFVPEGSAFEMSEDQ